MFVHYSLAPEHRYPTALDQVVRVYAWLRLQCPRVVVFGESAGGNLAAALTLRCIEGGLPVPDGMVLGYPAVNLNSSPSPSRAMHLNDPLIPVGESPCCRARLDLTVAGHGGSTFPLAGARRQSSLRPRCLTRPGDSDCRTRAYGVRVSCACAQPC